MKKNKFSFIPIVGDGALATPEFADGRLLPVLILDCKNHQDFFNLVCIHENTPPGDVISQWGGYRHNSRYVNLKLSFSKPAQVEIIIQFDFQKQAAIADSIVQAKAVYLQPSDFGDRVISGMGQPKIIVEIPPETKLPKWDKILLTQITKRLKKEGLRTKEAKQAAKQHIDRMREITSSNIQ